MSAKLSLIGCGPGAADLLTIRASRRIGEADLVLFDRLVEPDVLELASPLAEKRYVGKGCGDGGRQQADINCILKEALRDGRHVVRLKSGDPMVFGRAAEEVAIAVELEAEIEIVPGVTAALAAAAENAITVTERMELQSFVVTTGKSADPNKDPDWSNLVKPGVCVAFYMSVAQAWRIQTALMAKGVPGHIAADWIENSGRPNARRVTSRLDRLALDARKQGVSNPAILFIRYPLSAAAGQLSAQQAEQA